MQFFVKNRSYLFFLWVFFFFLLTPLFLVSVDGEWLDSCVMGKKNENNFILLKNFLLIGNSDNQKYKKVFGLFQGYLGDDCMHELCSCFNQNLARNLKTKESAVALKDSFFQAEKTINSICYKSAATALIVLLPNDNTIILANVGSCCAKMFRKNKNNKQLEPLYFPHDFNNWTEEERIEETGSTIVSVQGKPHFLGAIPATRAFGLTGKYDAIKPIPEIVSYTIQKDDRVLLIGTSEFFNCFKTKQLISIIDENVTSKEICSALKNALDEKIMKKKEFVASNVAFVVVRPMLLANCEIVEKINEVIKKFNDYFSMHEDLVAKIDIINDVLRYLKKSLNDKISVHTQKPELMDYVNQQTGFIFFDLLTAVYGAFKKIASHGNDDLYNTFKDFDVILEKMISLSCFSKGQIDALTNGRESIKKWCEKFEKIKKS